MPYIKEERREELYDMLDHSPGAIGYCCSTPGELNFALTETILEYINNKDGEKISYSRINEVVGVLECCKLELYRRLATPYEDKKIKENGDVY